MNCIFPPKSRCSMWLGALGNIFMLRLYVEFSACGSRPPLDSSADVNMAFKHVLSETIVFRMPD